MKNNRAIIVLMTLTSTANTLHGMSIKPLARLSARVQLAKQAAKYAIPVTTTQRSLHSKITDGQNDTIALKELILQHKADLAQLEEKANTYKDKAFIDKCSFLVSSTLALLYWGGYAVSDMEIFEVTAKIAAVISATYGVFFTHKTIMHAIIVKKAKNLASTKISFLEEQLNAPGKNS